MANNATMVNTTNLSSTTTHEVCPIYTDTADIFKIIGFVVIMVLSFTGNTIIVGLFARGRKQKKLDPFIISIAVSDLLVPFFAGVRELNSLILKSDVWQVEGTIGDVLCKICSFLTDISPIISILSMCCITVYQFIFVTFAITKPNAMQHSSHGERVASCVVISITWLVAISFKAHYFHTYKVYRIGEDNYCDGPFFENSKTHHSYLVATCIVFIIIPFVLITILNSFVAYKVRKQLKISARMYPQWQQNNYKKQKRNQIMIVLMILVFSVCWFPLGIAVWLYTFDMHKFRTDTCSYAAFHFVSVFMSQSNAAINPWIYLSFFVYPQRKRDIALPKPLTSLMASMIRKRKVGPANSVELEPNL